MRKTRPGPSHNISQVTSLKADRFVGLLRLVRLGSHWCHNGTTGINNPVHLGPGQVLYWWLAALEMVCGDTLSVKNFKKKIP